MGLQRVRPDWATFTFMQNLGKPTKNNVVSHTRNSRTCREAPETGEDAMWGAAWQGLWTSVEGHSYASGYLFIWLHWVLVLTRRIFSCSMWDQVPQPGIKPEPPALGAWSLSHWTTREVLASGCFTDFHGCHISANKNSEYSVKFQCQISKKKKKKCKYIPWNIWGHSYTKIFLVVYLKFKLNWTVCVLPDNLRREGGKLTPRSCFFCLLITSSTTYGVNPLKPQHDVEGKGGWWVRRGKRGGLSCFLPLHVSPWALGQALSVPLSLPN